MAHHHLARLYAMGVVAGGVVGALDGMYNAFDIIAARNRYEDDRFVTMPAEWKRVEGPLNGFCILGTIAKEVCIGGAVAGALVATFPVSIPLLLQKRVVKPPNCWRGAE